MDRYHRQTLLPQIGPAGQQKLAEARVLIVGVGALGTVLAESLVRAGVGRVTLADRDIAVALRRWARASGYDIVWDVGWVAPINGAMRVDAPTFLDAVRQVVAGLRAQGYPVQAQAFTDHVVRFTATE